MLAKSAGTTGIGDLRLPGLTSRSADQYDLCQSPSEKENFDMDYEALLELFKKRRSIRRFKQDPVPDDYIQKIIEAARWAPSGANTQPWEFIVVKEQEIRGKICGVFAESMPQARNMELTRGEVLRFPPIATPMGPPGFLTAPVFIIVVGYPRTKEGFPMMVNAIYLQGEATFIAGLASAFLYMHLAAASLGLGSQWLSATAGPYAQVMLKDMLGIPEKLHIYETMVLGYPDEKPRPRMVRERDEMVHSEHYDKTKFRTDAQIKSFISDMYRAQLEAAGRS
jgi:nitroreductase